VNLPVSDGGELEEWVFNIVKCGGVIKRGISEE
jgi:hypothetical protein